MAEIENERNVMASLNIFVEEKSSLNGPRNLPLTGIREYWTPCIFDKSLPLALLCSGEIYGIRVLE